MAMILSGAGVSAGCGIGNAVIIRENELNYSHVRFSGREKERERLARTVEKFCQVTEQMAAEMEARTGEKEAEILRGHEMMIQDPYMISQINEIIDGGQCAEAALDAVCTMYIEMFSGVEDERMRQRASDVKDIRSRMLSMMLGYEPLDIASVPEGTILIARDFTPSMTAGIDRRRVCGLLAEAGGTTSHSAILARALEIPAVMGVGTLLASVKDGDTLIVDGEEGQVILRPDEQTLAAYQQKREEHLNKLRQLEKYRDRPTLTGDGRKVQLFANVGSVDDVRAAVAAGAEGIGLFRTEFLFMGRSSLPTEEEQMQVYEEVSDLMEGRDVILRTLDIGGDKEIPYLGLEREENPFLGHRAIRYCLSRQDVFQVQLQAILRAGAKHRNLKIMLPLITCVEEIHGAKSLLEKCKAQLRRQGVAFDEDIQVGIMVETPAAVMVADLLAQEADFFSIGTNDLTQYVMAVDRGNPKVANLYSHFQVSVLRSIKSVAEAAHRAGIPVAMCGEAAADPGMIPLLLAFGLDEFSVSPASVMATRRGITLWTTDEARRITDEVMGLSDCSGITGYLRAVRRT